MRLLQGQEHMDDLQTDVRLLGLTPGRDSYSVHAGDVAQNAPTLTLPVAPG